jgi:deoxyribodipyrimidine photo-lyase
MSIGLVWLRRDLRLHDHHALSKACEENDKVYLCFIYDKKIIDKLPPEDRRITFIQQSLEYLDKMLAPTAQVIIRYGDPLEEIPKIIKKTKANKLYFNEDYEPYAKKRDKEIIKKLPAESYLDHLFFSPGTILNGKGETFKVFTPFKRAWLKVFYTKEIPNYKVDLKKISMLKEAQTNWPKFLGYKMQQSPLKGGSDEGLKLLKKFEEHMPLYHQKRDFPALEGTSNLSTYIRHGCISFRDMLRESMADVNPGSEIWLSELIWREFYHVILDAYPHVVSKCFREEYDYLVWPNPKGHLKAWKQGLTGFPIVDAAMRCFAATGLMHNRLRMIVASFLCKTLLVDWKLGEKYFAQTLMDFDLAANNGGWQWSSSTGVDAQPYFRIFNPYTQSRKFDPDGEFIKQWIPELSHLDGKEIHEPSPLLAPEYPQPIVDYKSQREAALKLYKTVK